VKTLLLLALLLLAVSYKQKTVKDNNVVELNKVATKYVKLGLTIGQYDPDFIISYYGPDSLKPTQSKSKIFPKDSLLNEVDKLNTDIKAIELSMRDTNLNRAKWLSAQLLAFSRRIKIFAGEYTTFDEESKELFGVKTPVYSETYYKSLVAQIDILLPGRGPIGYRFQKLAHKFIIPKNKVDLIFKATISESQKRTLKHIELPATESLTLEYVTNKSWGAYNWYKGDYKSVVQINTDLPISISQVIDVGSHESYPGHHVYNMLLEKNLYRDKGFVELSIYPGFSPQSVIAEGSANYGIELVFPGDEKIAFTKNVLLPMAGLDSSGVTTYFKALEIMSKLDYAKNDAAKGIINGTMSIKDAVRLLGSGPVAENQIRFIKQFRSYVINYNYGKDIVKNYIERQPGAMQSSARRWELYEKLLTNEILITDIQ
jgi:hypothetical protein